MIVVLPDEVDGLETIEARLGASYADWIAALAIERVDLELPRFTAATKLPLRALLKALGIRLAFDPDRADFSGMGGSLFIGNAIQKAWIETSEQGTEAAAVTEIGMHIVPIHKLDRLPRPPPVIFHADHPFLYLVRDVKSGAVPFLGRMVKPAD